MLFIFRAAAKEAEAFGYGGQAFYDPSQPQNLYMAPPPPGENRPPPYNETNKKENWWNRRIATKFVPKVGKDPSLK